MIVQWAVQGCAGFLEGVSPRPKVVAVLHWPEECGWVNRFYDQPGGIDAFVAVSELALPTLPDSYAGGVATIWNAVDPARLTPKRSRAEMRGPGGCPRGRRSSGSSAGWNRSTRTPRALARALPHLPADWHCVVVGEGDDRPRLEEAARADPRLHLPGGDRDAGSVLGAFDVLCVPSAYESFGLSLCEGLWAGVPVLSTRTGVCKLVGGLTREFPPGAPGEAIALTLYQDLYDPDATRARVERARAWARRELDPRTLRQGVDRLSGRGGGRRGEFPGPDTAGRAVDRLGVSALATRHPGAQREGGAGAERRPDAVTGVGASGRVMSCRVAAGSRPLNDPISWRSLLRPGTA